MSEHCTFIGTLHVRLDQGVCQSQLLLVVVFENDVIYFTQK